MVVESVSTVLDMYTSATASLQVSHNDACGPIHSAHQTIILHMMLT